MSRQLLVDNFGEDALERVISGCSPESQKILRGEISSDEMYPETTIAEFVTGAVKLIGDDKVPPLTRELAKQQVNTVLRFLLRFFATPKMLSANSQKLWGALHDTGKLEVVHGEDNRSHIVTITEFSFPTPEYEKASTEHHCGVLELSGAKNVRGTSEKIGPDTYRQWYVWE